MADDATVWAPSSGIYGPDTAQESVFLQAMNFDPEILAWRRGFFNKYGSYPNVNDANYDYRAAVSAGVRPAPYEHDAGAYHWPSTTASGSPLKAGNHPTHWMETFMQTYGVDPHEASAQQLLDAYNKGIIRW